MMEYRRRFEVRPESVGNLSNSMTEDRRQIETLPQPVFNSTPVSSSKRKIFAYYDESLKLKGYVCLVLVSSSSGVPILF